MTDNADLARPALQQAGDAIIVVNTHGIIREWNDACVATFGFTPEQALGQHGGGVMVVPRDEALAPEAGHRDQVVASLDGEHIAVEVARPLATAAAA